ncbi:hypothetical protein CspeluHIS016_0103580 [Cutaneotrichosporon spelunceum]|uniref:Uncharacterized protein n=1 Tax=Cutaneotrichosporon spelunceum TaxID=1672016 RepID=A0AAD3TNT2_9TREE|nr:hypothetical protein CspeluHIS016_0103580 [Cutaneotrichosporon spelunceum]
MTVRHSRSENFATTSMPSSSSTYSGSFEKHSFNLSRADSAVKPISVRTNSYSSPSVPFQLTTLERLLLARQNLGSPPAIVHAIRYPLAELPSRGFLEVRVSDLQFRLPRLNVYVAGAQTNRPRFENGPPWDAKEIVQEGHFSPNPHNDLDAEMSDILQSQEEAFTAQDFEQSPMFRVTILTSPRCNYGYIVPCFNHIMVDGCGALRLVHLLTAHGVHVPIEPFEKPSRLDDTVDLKPDARYLASIVFREIIVPKLPKPLQKKWKTKDPWPGERINAHPAESPSGFSFVRISLEVVDACKRAGKARGVRTFHPILKMAYMAAVWRVFGLGSTGTGNSLRLVALTSRDERRTRSGHSAVTGCYTTNPEYYTKVSGEQKFWSVTRAMANWLGDRGVFTGRYNNGVLNEIPEGLTPMDPNYDPARPTGWEQYLGERSDAAAPFRSSIGIFNLGVATLPQGAEDHAWSQTASPYGPVWNISVLTHEGGMRLSSVFRDGSAVTKAQTDALLDVLKVVLERIAFNDLDTTIDRLTG